MLRFRRKRIVQITLQRDCGSFILSALASLVLTEWIVPVYYQYMASKETINENLFIHTPTLIQQEMEYLCFLFVLCALIVSLVIFRIKHITLTEGIKGVKRQKHSIRNFMLGVQLFICFLFIAGAIGLRNIYHLAERKKEQHADGRRMYRIWKIELGNRKYKDTKKRSSPVSVRLLGLKTCF